MSQATPRAVPVAASGDIQEGRACVFALEEIRVAICRVQGKLYAIEDVCTHDGGPLGEGRVHGHALECPRHGARFDVRSGAATRMPAVFPVRVFAVQEIDGRVLVELTS